MSLQHIFNDCGLLIKHYKPVAGGDINQCYCLHANDAKYFLKVNDVNKYPGMFEKEVTGLQALHTNSTLTIPRVIKSGSIQTNQYLLLEWIEKGTPGKDFWQNFGAGLALMHLQHQPFFGWLENNFIGSLVQHNPQQPDWHVFYAECHIMPLVKDLFNSGIFYKSDMISAELFCKRIEQLFPAEPPALLHGDLWSGNYMIGASGHATVFDPAVYYGHREMDIGMTRLFGGFDQQFYDAYNETYPLEKEWKQRLLLTQLYPLLVHAVLFGEHYVHRTREIFEAFK